MDGSGGTRNGRGRKTASSDPDLGAWSYTYDTASELITQTGAKGQTTTFSYDVLGRMTGRVEPGMTSQWVYDDHLHLVQQAGLDHPRVGHAELPPRHRPSALQADRAGRHHALL
jgi:YD repeat-containing protein